MEQFKKDYEIGETAVDGFDLCSVLEWDGGKWNKIAHFHTKEGIHGPTNDINLQKDMKNAQLFAHARALVLACKEVVACLANAPERNYERNILETAIEKATK